MEKFELIAPCHFGLEAVMKREILDLGYEITSVEDGKVTFEGDAEAIAYANVFLRTTERILLKIGQFRAETFEELFEKTKALPWERYIPKDGKFWVTKANSVKSKLFSPSDIQSIMKKAMVERLKTVYHTEWFQEDGSSFPIRVSILKDVVTVGLDTSGVSLHKRGYRKMTAKAPITETLAAALLMLTPWKKDRILVDPFCGSGTFPIEAAMIARNVAPGLRRSFASEQWPRVGQERWRAGRVAAYQAIRYDVMPQIYGSDMSQEAIDLARENAEKAGVDDCITFTVCRAEEARLVGDYGCIITNPPYGERIGEVKEVEALYRSLGALLRQNATWGDYVITSMEYFESLFGRRADAKRKIFNGRIKTDYYQFYGPKPPKQKAHPATETK